MTKSKKFSAADGVFRFRLNNGTVLLIKEDPSTPVVSLNLWIEAGSIDERPDERGMAHLIEHMIFKGTSKRGVGEISRQVEAAGGYLNAFTSYEHTCFYVVLPSSQIQKALEIEFDAYLHSTFDAGELAKEKEVVFEEMRMRRDDPWSWSWELLFKRLFKRSPYHWPVIGDMDILREVPREKLIDYYHSHYVPMNTVVSIVGNVSIPRTLKWAKKHFEPVRRPKPPKRRFFDDPEPQGLEFHVEEGDVQQIYLSLGFPTVPIHHPDSAVLEVLAAILGDGAASRFNLALREKSQSADEAASEYFSGKYGGALVFQGLTDVKRVERCLVEMMAEVKKISSFGVPEAELEKVKNKVKASKIFEKQSMDGQAKTLGFWELQGGYEMEIAFLKALDAVDSNDLKRVCDKYIQPHRGSLVIYHPKGQELRREKRYWENILQEGWNSVGAHFALKRPATEKIRKLSLRNGSTLWAKERKNLPLVSLGVFAPGGFCKETEKNYGITTLMTKCLQKGTIHRSHVQFSQEIESYAAHLDPVLEKDYWGMQLDVIKPNFEKAFDLMLESFYEPAFSNAEVEKEKKLQISAIERLKDDPSEYVLLQSDLLSFTSTPYAHMPMGTVKTVTKLLAQNVSQWHHSHLSRTSLTWFAVGDFNPDEIKKFLDDRLPASKPKLIRKKIKSKPHHFESHSLTLPSDSQQANIVVGFRAPSFNSAGYFSFRVLNTLLNGMGGKLFIELREKKSLAYSVFAAHDAGALAGIYQIYLGCAPQKAGEAKREMLKVLDGFAQGKISEEELRRAKTYMIGLYQVGFQSNHSQVSSYARYELSGWGAPWVEKFPELIERVTLKEVQKAAKEYLGVPQKTWVTLTPSALKEVQHVHPG
jgi:zinc protease